jgi:deoxycytidine triphosphate deaminase
MHYNGLVLVSDTDTEILSLASVLAEKNSTYKILDFQKDSMIKKTQGLVAKTIEEGKTPLILANLTQNSHLTKLTEFQFISVFIRSKTTPDQTNFTYNIANNDLQTTAELINKLWQNSDNGGLVPQEFIKLMIKSDMLLENAELSNATGSAFDLTLDDEYYHNGTIKNLDTINSFIIMEPGDYALVGSSEIANLPRDIAGKFGLSVGLFMQGIILSNGPQIDPGFRGRLYCLLFNTSSQQFQLKRGQHYATIEFIKLLEPTLPYQGKYQGCETLSEYLPRSIPSSAIGELRKDVDGLKKEKWYIKILPLTISALSIAIALAMALPNLIRILTGSG